MTWQELVQDGRFLGGEVLCIHPYFSYPEMGISGTSSDFRWAKKPYFALVAKGPVDKIALNEERQICIVRWKHLDVIQPDMSLGERLKGEDETGEPDNIQVSMTYNIPKETPGEIVYLGTAADLTEVYLLSRDFVLALK